jgi:outer membrane protein assembly factor BamD (BamD/ComL family)
VRTLAASGVGYTWEAQKNYANAVTAYEALVRQESPRQFFFEEALIDLARAQALAGKPTDAVATYERLLKEAPDTRRAADVRARIADLQTKRP